DLCGVHRLREIGVLGEEAVAGMDRVGARLFGRADDLLRQEVAQDVDRLVRLTRVQRALVVPRHDGDGRDSERAARAEDAQRDLAAVRYEELADLHRAAAYVSRRRGGSAAGRLVAENGGRCAAGARGC